MAQERIRNIIIQLKALRESKGLTIQEIIDTLDRENQHLAKNTVVKVFSEGSEDMEYQYETIRTLSDVMFHVYSTDAEDDTEIKGLKSTIQYQNIIIDNLKAQMEVERQTAENMLREERASNVRRIEFLRDRVEKQDLRIEQKDRLITIMMMVFLRKFAPDMSTVNENGMQRQFDETMDEIVEYLKGEESETK